ncbi:hypothetical protein EV126DRAFT_439860 [Verticillium dahliae]|nr:hypothetical protein EV126DRAFT_439860 [Verticillium dahliae]
MAVLAVDPPTFLALDHALNDHDFQKSRTLYNGLKCAEDQPPVEDQHIQDLAALFVRHRAEKTLGIHLIHGHFQIPEGTVMDGPLPDLSNVGHGFLAEFSCYITSNNLAGLIGLQAIPTRITGWMFESSDGKPRVCQSNETHAEMSSGNHKVFNSGKPLPKLENVDDIKAVLVEAGVM